MTDTGMLLEEKSDGNEPRECLMHNYHGRSMLSHTQRDDAGLNHLCSFCLIVILALIRSQDVKPKCSVFPFGYLKLYLMYGKH